MKHPKRYMADGTATTTRVRGVEKRECAIHPRGCYAVLTSWAGDTIPRERPDWHAYLLSQSDGVGLLDVTGTLERETPQFKAGIRARVRHAEANFDAMNAEPELDDDKQECVSCGDDVYCLSSRGWCDGCEEEDELEARLPVVAVHHPHGKSTVHVEHDYARVAVYLHHPTDGSRPYLVIDVDSEDDDPPIAIYLNDGPLHKPTNS